MYVSSPLFVEELFFKYNLIFFFFFLKKKKKYNEDYNCSVL